MRKMDGWLNKYPALKWIAAALAGLVVLAIVVTLYFRALDKGWLVASRSPDQLLAILRPWIQLDLADSEVAGPVALLFHGCGGDPAQQRWWAEQLSGAGVHVVRVDSYSGRGIVTPRERTRVCAGLNLWGNERSGDVRVMIDWVAAQPWADSNRIYLAGWSHGAWAVMDALALDSADDLSSSLSSATTVPTAQLAGIALFYPYCGQGSASRSGEWPPVDVRVFLPENDTVVGNSCHQTIKRLQTSAENDGAVGEFQVTVVADLDHAFDVGFVASLAPGADRQGLELAQTTTRSIANQLANWMTGNPADNP